MTKNSCTAKITHVLDCIADPSKNRVIAELSNHVDAVFPYLNAVVPNLMYNPGANTVTVKRGQRILTFYPHVAVMAKVDGKKDAVVQLTWFMELCNDVWRSCWARLDRLPARLQL